MPRKTLTNILTAHKLAALERQSSQAPKHNSSLWRLLVIIALVAANLAPAPRLFAQQIEGQAPSTEASSDYVDTIRTFETTHLGLGAFTGLTYTPEAEALITLENGRADSENNLHFVNLMEELVSGQSFASAALTPINFAFDNERNHLLVYQATSNDLLAIPLNEAGEPETGAIKHTALAEFGVQTPRGMAYDAANESLLILDGAAPQILRLAATSNDQYELATDLPSTVALQVTTTTPLQGLAADPNTAHFFTVNPAERQLYEFSPTGAFVASHDLAALGIEMPQGMVFAPSGDSTDAPHQYNLYLVDQRLAPLAPETPTLPEVSAQKLFLPAMIGGPVSGGAMIGGANTTVAANAQPTLGESRIIELSLTPLVVGIGAAAVNAATLVQTIRTSDFSPPSPDAAGAVYIPSINQLLISDSEVEEMSIYRGANFFTSSLNGVLQRTATTVGYSNEPTGVAYNSVAGHLYVSDDDQKKVFTLAAGGDGLPGTQDDMLVATLNTRNFGSGDPEGVGFSTALNMLFIADGVNNEVYKIMPGANGLFDGVGDQVSQFDTAGFGVLDPEGIEYNYDSGTLYIAGKSKTEMGEATVNGVLVQKINIMAAGALRPAGVAYGPSSQNPSGRSIYLVDRGIDNDGNPSENDGKAFEFALSSAPPPVNAAPVVNAGPDQTITLPANATLSGVVSDDGNPSPSLLTFSWSKLSGPGTVVFANANSAQTTATFSVAGSYTLQLAASDSLLTTTDTIIITVQAQSSGNTAPIVNAGADQTITLPASATLSAIGNDDGNPNPPGQLTYSWIKVSGPGTVAFGNANSAQTTAVFSAAGAYTLRVTASDSLLAASDDVNITVQPQSSGGSGSLDIRIATGTDDAEEKASGSANTSSGDLELVFDGSNQTVGLRFVTVNIPKGAAITNAYLQFTVDESSTDVASLTLRGQAADNPATFTTATGNISSRPTTAAFVAWAPAVWLTVGVAGADQRSPNLAAILQEIVNRPGWNPGNALVFLITGSGRRTARSYNGGATAAPLLHVEYNGGSSGTTNLAPTVNAGPDQTITLPASATLSGAVGDDGNPNPPGQLTPSWSKVSGPGTVTFEDPSNPQTTATFSVAGDYTLRLSASDSLLTTTDDINITVQPQGGGGSGSLDIRIGVGTDDAEQAASGGVDISSSDLELVFDGSNQIVGLRFPGVNLPKGAIITTAYIQFTVDETSTDVANLSIQGEAADNPATFATTAGNLSTRTKTSSAVGWAPAPWSVVGAAGSDQRTPNLAVILQEIVNRPGWNPGNALVFMISGSGRRTAEAYNGVPAAAALLHVEFTVVAN